MPHRQRRLRFYETAMKDPHVFRARAHALEEISALKLSVIKPTAVQFAVALLPPLTWHGRICFAETIRRDLKLAVAADLLPADAKFWVRELSHSPVSTVELFAWPGIVLAEDYATAVMEGFLAKGETQWTAHASKEPPQDARFSLEVNEALRLLKTCTDQRVAQAMEAARNHCYGPVQYRVEIGSARLIVAARRGLRVEVDPEYAAFVHRARLAGDRLGRRVVRQLCGEGGVDFGGEQDLERLVAIDDEAQGRPVKYSRTQDRWVLAEEQPGQP